LFSPRLRTSAPSSFSFFKVDAELLARNRRQGINEEKAEKGGR